LKYIDHHVHTSYSPDAEGEVIDYIKRARMSKQNFIVFTDHADFGTRDKDFMVHIDYDRYFKVMKELEEVYAITIKIGVEIGYEKNYKGEIREFLNKYPFDFVIASIHYGDDKDFYLGDFFQGKSQDQAYKRYFEILLEMVENFSDYDVVGHLDYITRYGPYENKYYDYENYREIVDKILKAIIEKGKGIEVNTSGLREATKSPYPKKEVLESYRNMGGRIITLGSDAHGVEDYSAGIEEGISLLESLGFSELSQFKQRKESRLPLSTNKNSLG